MQKSSLMSKSRCIKASKSQREASKMQLLSKSLKNFNLTKTTKKIKRPEIRRLYVCFFFCHLNRVLRKINHILHFIIISFSLATIDTNTQMQIVSVWCQFVKLLFAWIYLEQAINHCAFGLWFWVWAVGQVQRVKKAHKTKGKLFLFLSSSSSSLLMHWNGRAKVATFILQQTFFILQQVQTQAKCCKLMLWAHRQLNRYKHTDIRLKWQKRNWIEI